MSRKIVDTEKELLDIFDQVIDRFEKDLDIILSSEMERKKFLHIPVHPDGKSGGIRTVNRLYPDT